LGWVADIGDGRKKSPCDLPIRMAEAQDVGVDLFKVEVQLAKFFNFEISRLADRFLIEIEENVNSGAGTRQGHF
jgi:hypothetical protein